MEERLCPLPKSPRKIKRITFKAFLDLKELLNKIKRPKVKTIRRYRKAKPLTGKKEKAYLPEFSKEKNKGAIRSPKPPTFSSLKPFSIFKGLILTKKINILAISKRKISSLIQGSSFIATT